MKSEIVIKGWVIAVLTALSAWLGSLAIPVYVLVGMNLIDYITGVATAKHRNQKINSAIGFWGAVKKIFMWLLVVVGCCIDALILYVASGMGVDYEIKFVVGSLVAVWLAVNEIISILENLVDMGVHIPGWLLPLVKNLHSKINNKAEEVQKDE